MYSDLSKKLTKSLDKKEKKDNGIFFTPPITVDKNLCLLSSHFKNIKTVLEPSCGSCEYITKLKDIDNVKITGIEYNTTIFDSIKDMKTDNVMLLNDDYLTHEFDSKFDLIIGNPPYYVMKKVEVDKSYHKYFTGRPNIFILFIIKSLSLLNKNGILSFVLPKNFLNCLYYDNTRRLIYDNYTILNIVECDDNYLETQQDTIILIIQNKKGCNDDYVLNISSLTVFGIPEYIKKLKDLYKDSTTLNKLGYTVSVGTVVWNQCKSILTDDSTKTLLVYSSDIKDNELKIVSYSNKDKKNYIAKDGSTDPVLVINRGYGKGAYSFNYCIINGDKEYLIENHLIQIKGQSYEKIIDSLNDERTKTFIKLYFGNNAMNTIELSKVLPIYC